MPIWGPAHLKHRFCLLLWAAMACGDDAAELCTVEALEEALWSAEAGDTVMVGACRIEGAFRIPDGVRVLGQVGSVVAIPLQDGADGVVMSGEAVLESVAIESAGGSAVLVRNGGTLRDVRIEAERGAAVAVAGGSVRFERVELIGPVSDPLDGRWVRVEGFAVPGECAEDCECVPGEVRNDAAEVCDASGEFVTFGAVYGIFARDAQLELVDVSIRQFALAGAVFEDSTVRWEGGGVSDGLGTGVLLRGGAGELIDVRVEAVGEGLRGTASYGVIAQSAELRSQRLTVVGGDRYGVLLRGSTGTHEDFVAEGNGDVGLWISESIGVAVNGASRIEDNAFSGVVVVDGEDVNLDGLRVAGTRSVLRTLGSPFGAREIGDGIHLQRSPGVTLRGLAVEGNERVGVLVELGPELPAFADVRVDAVPGGFGAIAGSAAGGELTADAPEGWDTGITRGPEALARDAAIGTTVALIRVSAPPTAVEQALGVIPMF